MPRNNVGPLTRGHLRGAKGGMYVVGKDLWPVSIELWESEGLGPFRGFAIDSLWDARKVI